MATRRQVCPECNGRGRLDNPRDLLGTETCPTCTGTGRAETPRDLTPRALPETFHCMPCAGAIIPRQRADVFPPDLHPDGSCIRTDLACVRVTLACGHVRWFGADRAHINSALDVVLIGHDPRDEVRCNWRETTEH